jgi:hypothetical protein
MRYLWLLCLPYLWLLCLLNFSFLQVNAAFSLVTQVSSDLSGIPRTDKLVSWNHAKAIMSASTAQRLWAESSPTAFRCLYHPFVSGLALGNLPVRTFQHYIGNEFLFLVLVGFCADIVMKLTRLAGRSGFFLSLKLRKGLHEGIGPRSFQNG